GRRTMSGSGRGGLLALSFVLFFATSGPESHAAPEAHPALWKVHGARGTAYLFGSIHVLPQNINWRTPKIDAAIRQSNVLVFEIPNDPATQARLASLVAEKGQLPSGTSLRMLLSPEARPDYDADLALTGV